jgi:YD repeat-containing protein
MSFTLLACLASMGRVFIYHSERLNCVAGDLTSLMDGNSHTTQWGYDLYGRVTNKVDATSTTILKYQYDADSRLTNRWSLGRTNTIYAYDKVGNLTGVTYQASHALTFAYDALNRLTNMADAVGTTTFSYTPAGQLASENGPWTSDQISYTYANRQRASLSVEQPAAPSLAEAYAYDGANRLTSITAPPGVFGYQYAAGTQGLVAKISLPNNAYISNFYDALARLTNTTMFNSTNEALDLGTRCLCRGRLLTRISTGFRARRRIRIRGWCITYTDIMIRICNGGQIETR